MNFKDVYEGWAWMGHFDAMNDEYKIIISILVCENLVFCRMP